MNLKNFIGKFFALLFFGLVISFSYEVMATSPKMEIPIYFVQNHGQVADNYLIYGRGLNYQILFSKKGVTYSFAHSELPIELGFVNAQENFLIEGMDKQIGKVNFFKGKNPSQWMTNLSTYKKVAYRDVYSGIDYIVEGKKGFLESEFHVKPAADPKQIRLSFGKEVKSVKINKEGDLIIRGKRSVLIEKKPFVYQLIKNKKVEVVAEYWTNKNEYGFKLGDYDSTKNLIIDPVTMVYSTYLGGDDGLETVQQIVVDSSGSVYVTGTTVSNDFPATSGAYQTSGSSDIYIAKFSTDGASLVYATYFGGSDATETVSGMIVDTSGNVYVSGVTSSSDFPTTSGAYDTSYSGDGDVFVSKLSSGGSSLTFSTCLGGSDPETSNGIFVNRLGRVYVAGTTSSSGFPTTSGAYQTTYGGDTDIFISMLNADGSKLAHSTYLGGNDPEELNSWTVDGSGNVYVSGTTYSSDFPTSTGAYQASYGDNGDAFISKINISGP